MTIDSHLPPHQPVITPVRPDPVPPGRETVRPVPTPNGAEAGARHPLQDNQRQEGTRAERRSRADAGRGEAGRSAEETELSDIQRQQLEALEVRDREVRAHEAAHKAAAGGLALGAASFEYQLGPDGRHYAVGGEVSIDTSRTGDPQRDLEKARTLRRAALAPAEPSAQDRRVALEAAAMEAAAQQELQAERAARQQQVQARAEGTEAANDAFNPESPERAVPDAAPTRIGERIDVFA